MTEKMTEEYGFMASRDGDEVMISDNQGGGERFAAYSRDEAYRDFRSYMERLADLFAESMVDELFDDEDDDEGGSS